MTDIRKEAEEEARSIHQKYLKGNAAIKGIQCYIADTLEPLYRKIAELEARLERIVDELKGIEEKQFTHAEKKILKIVTEEIEGGT